MKYQAAEIEKELAKLNDWQVADNRLVKTFTFKSYFNTIAFVNAVAWISQKAKHHPDLTVQYGKVIVEYTTHDAGNTLTENDFNCAQEVDRIHF